MFGILHITTAAESPFSNGICERHNVIITEMFKKLSEGSSDIDSQIVLQQAVFAKNVLHNNEGFSPYQLVYGGSPSLPSVMNASPAALENVTVSKYVANHLTMLSKARSRYAELEFSTRIKKALSSRFISNEGPFHPGQTVYYKRQNKDKWFDPARVLALKIIIVRHGGQLYRAHSIHVRRSPTEDPFLRLEHDDRSEKPSRDRPGVPINPGEKFLDAHETSNPDGSSSEITNGSTNVDSLVCQNNQACLEDGAESDSRDKPATQTVLEVVKTVSTSNASDIKPGKVIRYYHGDAEETAEARVLSRAGKANEKHCHWFNIEYLKPEDLLGTRGSFDVSKSVENVSES